MALTPLRHWVMGAAARERAATATEAADMAKVFRQAMQDGAFGFSTTVLGIHVGHEGQPLACRHADHGEYRALCGVLKELDRGAIELTVTPTDTVSAAQRELLQLLVEESGRPVTYVGSFNTPGTRDTYVQKMAALTDLIGRDRLVPQTTCHPIKFQFHLRNPFILGIFECWRPVMAMSQEDKIRAYRAPEFRQQFRRDILKNEALSVDFWDRVRLIDGQSAATLKLAESKHSVARMAADAGRDPVDVMFDIAFADDLGAIFELVALNHDAAEVVPLIQDPRLLIGLSDAGAHVDMMCDAGYATYMLARWVREQKVLRMEEAVRRLTSEQAGFFGIPNAARSSPATTPIWPCSTRSACGRWNRKRSSTCPAAASAGCSTPRACSPPWSTAPCCTSKASTRGRCPAGPCAAARRWPEPPIRPAAPSADVVFGMPRRRRGIPIEAVRPHGNGACRDPSLPPP